MDINAHIDAATRAVEQQIETTNKSLNNAYDAADRLITLRAVDATIRMAQTPVKPTDPTT